MSLTKTESNRINAKTSTGPITPAGKAAVKFNALKLGIYTKDVVLPTEDPTQYRELLAACRSEYAPETATEIYLFENIVISIWRRRRVQAAEAGLQDLHHCKQSERIKENLETMTANVEMANAKRVDYTNARMLSDIWRHAPASNAPSPAPSKNSNALKISAPTNPNNKIHKNKAKRHLPAPHQPLPTTNQSKPPSCEPPPPIQPNPDRMHS